MRLVDASIQDLEILFEKKVESAIRKSRIIQIDKLLTAKDLSDFLPYKERKIRNDIKQGLFGKITRTGTACSSLPDAIKYYFDE